MIYFYWFSEQVPIHCQWENFTLISSKFSGVVEFLIRIETDLDLFAWSLRKSFTT